LWIAPFVGEITGVDAAPRMIQAARRAMASSGVGNASFDLVDADKLPYRDGEFDGGVLCGVLESMDWDSVQRTLTEVRRVMSPGSRIAVLDQDWRDVLARSPLHVREIRLRKGRLMLQVVERTLDPHTEVTSRYTVEPQSPEGRRMLEELRGRVRAQTKLAPEDLALSSVTDANYDVSAQFDADTLAKVVSAHGFGDLKCESVTVQDWGQRVLFLTGKVALHE
jgi:SAM-dependent methyltransferase